MNRVITTVLGWLLVNSVSAAEPDPLFASSEILDIKLTAAFSEIDDERDKEKEYEGLLSYVDDAGTEHVFEVGLEVRGNWRLQKKNCRYSQLWVDLKRGQTPGTLFENQNRLKLVVQCGTQDRFQEFLAKEHQAYQMFSELSELHFDARLLNVTYIDSEEDDRSRTHLAFFIEHQSRLRDRFGMEEVELNNVPYRSLDGGQSTLVGMFMYLIGNTDYSMVQAAEGDECCHNSKLLVDAAGRYYPIPYDFDASGFVDASYAPDPNPDFGIRNNRSRLYRGFCVPDDVLNGALEKFRLSREHINGVVADTTHISERTAQRTRDYVDDFYEVIDDSRKLQREINRECRG